MIINGYDDFNILKSRMDAEYYIQTRIHRDFYAHPSVNPILCCIVTFLNGDTFTYSVSHRDAPAFELITTTNELNADVAVYKNNKPFVQLNEYFTPFVNNSHSMFTKMRDVNKTIPLTVWGKIGKRYHNTLLRDGDFKQDLTYQFLNNAVSCLRDIESAGIAVDVDVFKTFFDNKAHITLHNKLVYSQYYPYTITGRPSNRFGGINFAALNKSDGSRSAFVSRFEGGSLVQLDFDAYHLRLIANYMNVELPNEPVHEYLAKQYFGKSDISPEEYEEGKQITFSILYGADVDTDILLLRNIKRLSKDILDAYNTNSLVAPISGRTLSIESGDATENKLFNYFVQNLEFESTVEKLQAILKFLQTKQSKLILYTYDAILLDCHPDELNLVMSVSSDILKNGGYPVRVYTGSNYGILERDSMIF